MNGYPSPNNRSLLIGQSFKGGLPAMLLGQIARLIGIAIYRTDRKP